ncbi:P1 family peptidase [Histidinibacterium lentulum]|uniref:Peptidase S58 family protein n=1 Tax=Histidinibacterium lentulum TaxID=2480588 RepID=A0A3N2R0P4_9RHOB|nr:P1 family peptidase [Histidinibacterium lentulum]ROU01045.1 peptidase S58 family protein [Histidinibacterium lentulum]
MQTGPKNLLTDVPGLLVGNAACPRRRSGVTVVTSSDPFAAGVHVMGGAPGTRETDLLAPDKTVSEVHALVLAGGSAFGLAAAQGVAEALAARGKGFEVAGHRVPIVPAAILFDLANGGDTTGPLPYHRLGAEALAAAGTEFALGTAGAGAGATTATLKGGLGSASLMVGEATVAALVAVNALGSATVGDGPHFWAAPFEIGAEFGGLGQAADAPADWPRTKLDGATTIAVVATDARLDKSGCTRLAIAAHDGMARALVPSHTAMDGDLVFALSTGSGPETDPVRLAHGAALCLARAIARAVWLAASEPGDLLPAWRARFG